MLKVSEVLSLGVRVQGYSGFKVRRHEFGFWFAGLVFRFRV